MCSPADRGATEDVCEGPHRVVIAEVDVSQSAWAVY